MLFLLAVATVALAARNFVRLALHRRRSARAAAARNPQPPSAADGRGHRELEARTCALHGRHVRADRADESLSDVVKWRTQEMHYTRVVERFATDV